MLGAWCLESPPVGILLGGEEGDVEHIYICRERSSCWALKAQTCDCCLYLDEQKGMDVVKGRRQSWLKYSVDSCSGGDSAHCGGPACDVSGEGSARREGQPSMRGPLCRMEITGIRGTPGHVIWSKMWWWSWCNQMHWVYLSMGGQMCNTVLFQSNSCCILTKVLEVLLHSFALSWFCF